ncbi:hypothetical protein P5E46_24780 [Vibrio parahaemolyticus]|nr:hypothetical protein [Vibrio parahaemolyticus]
MSNNIKHETDYSHDWTVEPNGGVTEVALLRNSMELNQETTI